MQRIPRNLFFGNPSRNTAKISPDGTNISFLAPVDDVLNIWVAPRNDLDAARAVTLEKGRGIRTYEWAYNGTHLIYLQDQGGNEKWRLYSLEISTGKLMALTPFAGARVSLFPLSTKFPNECLFALNVRNRQYSDVWKVNVVTGELTFVMQNDEFGNFVVDSEFRVRVSTKDPLGGSVQYFKRSEEGEWLPLSTVPPEDSESTRTLAISLDGKLWTVSSVGRDTGALVALDLESGAESVLALDSQCDIEDCLFDPISRQPLAYSINRLKKRWQILDPQLEKDFALLHKLPGDFSIESQTVDNRTWIVVNNRADRPGTYLLFDRDSEQLTELFNLYPDLDGLPLREMHAIEIPARDGLSLVCYYTLLAEVDPEDVGKPKRPLPLILYVHGGPWLRDIYGYSATHQWFANRGYAVLSVNYRGSGGFGKKFINASNHQWSGAMHDDLIDAVDWAIQQGITNRDTVAIYGGSYGGYATLVGLTFTPDRFAAGVDLVGPSNLVSLIESFPEEWKPLLESSWYSRVGNPEKPEDRERLLAQSPISRVRDIRAPLLIAQGANDPRVVQAESDQIVRVMEEAALPVTYILFPDEGHGFGRSENRLAFYAVVEAFLGKVFNRESEAIAGSLEGSSIQVPNGAGFVPELQEAVATHKPVARN